MIWMLNVSIEDFCFPSFCWLFSLMRDICCNPKPSHKKQIRQIMWEEYAFSIERKILYSRRPQHNLTVGWRTATFAVNILVSADCTARKKYLQLNRWYIIKGMGGQWSVCGLPVQTIKRSDHAQLGFFAFKPPHKESSDWLIAASQP